MAAGEPMEVISPGPWRTPNGPACRMELAPERIRRRSPVRPAFPMDTAVNEASLHRPLRLLPGVAARRLHRRQRNDPHPHQAETEHSNRPAEPSHPELFRKFQDPLQHHRPTGYLSVYDSFLTVTPCIGTLRAAAPHNGSPNS